MPLRCIWPQAEAQSCTMPTLVRAGARLLQPMALLRCWLSNTETLHSVWTTLVSAAHFLSGKGGFSRRITPRQQCMRVRTPVHRVMTALDQPQAGPSLFTRVAVKASCALIDSASRKAITAPRCCRFRPCPFADTAQPRSAGVQLAVGVRSVLLAWRLMPARVLLPASGWLDDPGCHVLHREGSTKTHANIREIVSDSHQTRVLQRSAQRRPPVAT